VQGSGIGMWYVLASSFRLPLIKQAVWKEPVDWIKDTRGRGIVQCASILLVTFQTDGQSTDRQYRQCCLRYGPTIQSTHYEPAYPTSHSTPKVPWSVYGQSQVRTLSTFIPSILIHPHNLPICTTLPAWCLRIQSKWLRGIKEKLGDWR